MLLSRALHGSDVRRCLPDHGGRPRALSGLAFVAGGQNADHHPANDDAATDEGDFLEVLAQARSAFAWRALDAQDSLLGRRGAVEILVEQTFVQGLVVLNRFSHDAPSPPREPVATTCLTVPAGHAAGIFADADNQFEGLRQAIEDVVAVHEATVHQISLAIGDAEHGGRVGVFHVGWHLQIGVSAPCEDAHGLQIGALKIGMAIIRLTREVEVQACRVDAAHGGNHSLLPGLDPGLLSRPRLRCLLLHVDHQLLRVVEADQRHVVMGVAHQGHVIDPPGVGRDHQVGH